MSVIVIGPNPLLQIGQKKIVIGRIRSLPQQILKRPRNIIKVGLPTQSEKSALLVKRHFTRARLVYIRRLAPHIDIQLTFSFEKEVQICYRRRRRERVAHIWERTFCISLRDLLALYWLSILRKFCWVFFP
jgi:hypothetical protein